MRDIFSQLESVSTTVKYQGFFNMTFFYIRIRQKKKEKEAIHETMIKELGRVDWHHSSTDYEHS